MSKGRTWVLQHSLVGVCLIGCMGAWLQPRAALAQPELAVDWEAPEGCPDRTAVEAALGRYLGASEVAGRVDVEGTVRQAEGPFSLQLRISLEGGSLVERRLEARECSDLAEATALLVALVIDPDLEPPPPVPTEESPEKPPPPAPAEEPQREVAEPPRPLPRGFSLELAGMADTAVLASVPAFGPRITPRWHGRWFGAGMQVAGLFETAQPSDSYPEADVSSGVVLAAPELCFDAPLGRFTVSPCAHLEVGATWLTTHGIESPSSAWDVWVAAGAEARLQWWVRPRWSLDLGVGLIVPLRRSTFAITTQGGPVALHRAPPAGLRVSLGVTYAAWP